MRVTAGERSRREGAAAAAPCGRLPASGPGVAAAPRGAGVWPRPVRGSLSGVPPGVSAEPGGGGVVDCASHALRLPTAGGPRCGVSLPRHPPAVGHRRRGCRLPAGPCRSQQPQPTPPGARKPDSDHGPHTRSPQRRQQHHQPQPTTARPTGRAALAGREHTPPHHCQTHRWRGHAASPPHAPDCTRQPHRGSGGLNLAPQ